MAMDARSHFTWITHTLVIYSSPAPGPCKFFPVLENPFDRSNWRRRRICPRLYPCLLSSPSCRCRPVLPERRPYSCPLLGPTWCSIYEAIFDKCIQTVGTDIHSWGVKEDAWLLRQACATIFFLANWFNHCGLQDIWLEIRMYSVDIYVRNCPSPSVRNIVSG